MIGVLEIKLRYQVYPILMLVFSAIILEGNNKQMTMCFKTCLQTTDLRVSPPSWVPTQIYCVS